MEYRPPTAKEEQIIERLDALDLSALYTELGQQLGEYGPGEDPQTGAKSWLAAKREKIHHTICVKGNYCAFIAKNRHAKSVDIIAALSDTLTTVFGGVPIYTLATLLFRLGLDEYCKCKPQG